MIHELKPRSGSLPSAAEVARLLALEFPIVVCDESDGMKQAHARAEWIERAPPRVFLGYHQQALDAAERFRKLSPGEALAIVFGDDPRDTKRIVVIPGEPITFGYASVEDMHGSKGLVERCARVLDCDLVLA